MKRNWIDSYITKLKKESYEMTYIINLLEKYVNEINQKIENTEFSKVDIDIESKEIVFPDCVLKFKAEGKVLTFEKLSRGNRAIINTVRIVDDYEEYKLKLTNNLLIGSFDNIDDAIENALRYLLVIVD